MHPFIYINGYPGVGKLTVARELERILPKSKIYDNHLLIDPIAELVDRSSPEYNAVRTNLRRLILDVIATSESTRGTTWIFTDSRCTNEVGSSAVQDYVDASEKRDVPFVPVIMTCDPEENARRIVDEGRGKGGRTKLRDMDVLRSIREQEDMYRFGHELELELDVSCLSPQKAAQRIVDHVTKVMEI
ncbi:hypothetical protein CONLIGDRAFT_637563 [Coniochaeta ligniaria NRRL 30616]|uniref:P-loop containing nucleoside triphosphate hydrolase protein n=1 Tax=Coniochaeta ligniaria NRRL 30616 TaxID=1408157 RepID=A0A1J7I849_9PEZI|nr:hypothetical protein CONLIGDRAFT_637563 [Coniochaeta ligniaria NRRL 30616]